MAVTIPFRGEVRGGSARGRGPRRPGPENVPDAPLTRDPGVQAPEGAFGGFGEGLVEAGATVNQIFAEKAAQERRAAAKAFEAQVRTKATIDAQQALIEAEREGRLSDPDFTESFQERLETINQAAIEEARQKFRVDDEIISQVQGGLQLSQASTVSQAMVKAHNARVAVEVDSINQNIDALTTQVFRDPAFYGEAVDTGFDLLEGSKDLLSDDAERKIRDSINVNLGVAHVEGMIERNPGATLRMLRAGEFDDLDIGADNLIKLEDQAQSEIDSQLIRAERAERIRQQRLDRQREALTTQYAVSILSGQPLESGQAVDQKFLVRELAAGRIDRTRFGQLDDLLDTEERGEDDPAILLSLTQDVVSAEPGTIDAIFSARRRGLLTPETSANLLEKFNAAQRRGGPLANDTVKRERNRVDDILGGVRGPLAVLDSAASARVANALTEFDDRVLEGEDPRTVANDVIERFRLQPPSPTEFPSPLFLVGPRSNPNIDATRRATLEALDRGDISRDVAARELQNLEDIEAALQERGN